MPTLDQLGKTQDLVAGNPLAFVAAFFALAFVAQAVLYLRMRDRKDREIEQLNADRMAMAKEQTTLIVDMLKALPPSRKHRPKPEAPDGESKTG